MATLERDDLQLAEAARALVSMGMSYELIAAGSMEPLADFEQCYVIKAPNPTGSQLDDLVATNLVSMRLVPDLVGEPTSTFVDLPVGRAGRIDAATHREDPGLAEPDVYLSGYLVMGDGLAHVVNCLGLSPRDDFWSPILETFELLPPAAVPSMPG